MSHNCLVDTIYTVRVSYCFIASGLNPLRQSAFTGHLASTTVCRFRYAAIL